MFLVYSQPWFARYTAHRNLVSSTSEAIFLREQRSFPRASSVASAELLGSWRCQPNCVGAETIPPTVPVGMILSPRSRHRVLFKVCLWPDPSIPVYTQTTEVQREMKMSHLSRRRFMQLTGTAFGASLLVACTAPAGAPGSEDGDAPAAEPITIRYGRHDPGNGVTATIDTFMEENPNIVIEMEQIGEFHARISAMAAANTLPDAVRSWEAMVLEMGRNDQFIDLQPLIDLEPDFNPEDFYEAWWEYPVVDGKRFGIPDASAPHVTFYNVDLFDEMGVEYPALESFTWNDYEERARAISDPDTQIWGSDTIPVGWHMYSVKQVWQNGGRFYSPEYEECWLDRPEAIEAIQYWADLLLDGNVMPTPSQIVGIGGEGATAELMQAGQLGMKREGSWISSDLIDAGVRFNITHEPSSEQRATIQHGAFNAVANSSDHKDEAWAWVAYNTSTQGIYNYCSEAKFPGTRRSTNELEPKPWVADVDFEVDWDVIPQSLEYGHILPGPANEGEALKIIGDALEMVYNGNAEAASIFPEIAPQVTAVISEV